MIDDARSRRAKLDSIQLILCRYAVLDKFGFLALRLVEFFHNLGTKVLIELYDLKLGFADLCLRLGDGRYHLPALAVDPCALALQGRQSRQRHQPLVVQILDPFELARDQVDLTRLGLELRIEAGNLFAKLRDTALQQVPLAVAHVGTRIELRHLRRQNRLDPGLG